MAYLTGFLSGWNVLRDIDVSGGFAGDAVDVAASQTLPADVAPLRARRGDGGDAPTSSLKTIVALLDSGGALVARGSMSFDVRIIEVVNMAVDGSELLVVSEGTKVPLLPYQQWDFTGVEGSSPSGGVWLAVTNVANIPGTATRMIVAFKEA